ncbi:hypothetical protein MNV49_002488 [Pseudohyphozyma bogoriensis]|nr:hypothetical protein MNV49_002488 [Pseudohyphozyma bogoriensis]
MSPIAADTIHSAPATKPSVAPGGKEEATFHQSLDGLDDKPVDRIWRGNKAGTIGLSQKMPVFGEDMDSLLKKRQWIKEHMAGVFQFWGKRGYGEGLSGHITVRDPILKDHYWMNPVCVHFSLVTVSNLVLVGPGGWVSEHGAQLPINTAGYWIHSAIHDARPDVMAAAHCHSIHGRAWSVFGKKLDIFTQDSCFFHDNQGVYNNFGGLVLAAEEGDNIAKALGPKFNTCILQNHGLMVVGKTVDEVGYVFSNMENQCRLQLMVEASLANPELKKTVIDPVDAAFTAATLQNWENIYVNMQPEYELIVHERGDFFLK